MKITICGSVTFLNEMAKVKDDLVRQGFEVLTPQPFVSEDSMVKENGMEYLLDIKPKLTRNHWKRIEGSDAVLIVNPEKKGIKGYFGSNTVMELSVALYLNKKLFFLNSFSEDHPHYEELARFDGIFLDGDLSKIK
jgi:hypothetical protein